MSGGKGRGWAMGWEGCGGCKWGRRGKREAWVKDAELVGSRMRDGSGAFSLPPARSFMRAASALFRAPRSKLSWCFEQSIGYDTMCIYCVISARARVRMVTSWSDKKTLKPAHAVLAFAAHDPHHPDSDMEKYPVCPLTTSRCILLLSCST